MKASEEQIEALLEIQEADKEIVRLKKDLASLPQRKIIVEAREKKRLVQEKYERVKTLSASTKEKLAKVKNEDALLEEKQKAAQDALDKAQNNYRDVESRAKEMAGYTKRRDTLKEEIDTLDAELKSAQDIEAQVSLLLESINAKEQAATKQFQEQGTALQAHIANAQAKKEKLAKTIPAEIVQDYEKTAARSGGVALSYLKDGSCGACRATIEGGRLLDLKAQAPLGKCPNCARLLVIK